MRLLHVRIDSFRVFLEYAERMKNTQKKIHFQQCLGSLKGKYLEKIEGMIIYLSRMNSLQIEFFGIFLKQKLLHAYTENTLNSEISTKSVYISINNNMNFL